MNATQITGIDVSQQKLVGTTGPDARRMRKAIFRRTIDYNASIMNYLKNRTWQCSSRSYVALQPDYLYNYLVIYNFSNLVTYLKKLIFYVHVFFYFSLVLQVNISTTQ